MAHSSVTRSGRWGCSLLLRAALGFPCGAERRRLFDLFAFFSLVGLLPELIDILVDVSITVNVKCTNFESGTVQVVAEDCLCVLGAVKVKLLSG